MYVCMYVCIYIYIDIHIYRHTHTQTHTHIVCRYLSHVRSGGEDELAANPLFLVIKTEQKTRTWKVALVP